MKITIAIKSLVVTVLALSFMACSTAPKGELSSSANPQEEIKKLSSELVVAQVSHVDVLGRKDFMESSEFLDQAKKDLANGKDQERVIDDLRYAKRALKMAYSAAGNRKAKVPSLFEARQKAMEAGASHSSRLEKEWNSLDEDLAAQAERIDKVSPEKIEQYQARYVELEKKAVVESQLGQAKAQMSGARSEGAAKMAPEALRKAEMSINNAESLIGSNMNNPPGYRQAVSQAVADASYLSEVVETVKNNGKSLTEAAAAKLVLQRHQITDLRENLSATKGTISVVESKLDQRNKALADKEMALEQKDMVLQRKNVALGAAEANVIIQAAIEKSRQQFSPSEAEAYQQGDHLLIRLKSMNFKSGHSDLPAQSLALLEKVSEVAKSLDAKEIKIQGHTDSIGTSEINKKLSEQRAKSVATYFKTNGFEDSKISSEGFGYENPIATNKSKEGRAQNRRVDIIITPEGETMMSQ